MGWKKGNSNKDRQGGTWDRYKDEQGNTIETRTDKSGKVAVFSKGKKVNKKGK